MRPIPPPILVATDLMPRPTIPKNPSPSLNSSTSQWLTTDSPSSSSSSSNNSQRKSPIVRVIKAHPLPGRSVSTFQVLPSRMKQNAAPLPALPTKMEIQDQKLKIEQEIQCVRAELSSLMHQRNFYDHDPNSNFLIPTASSIQTGVKEYHNLLICNSIIDNVVSDNLSKKRESLSHSCGATSLDGCTKYKTIGDLPLYFTTIKEAREVVAPIFMAHFESRELIKRKQEGLAKEYADLQRSNGRLSQKINEYNCRVDSVSENWPEEFPKGQTKTEEQKELLKWTAPDQPMLMTKIRLMTSCYYDTNGFVGDPKAAHDSFRGRISWSDDERKKFVTKYMLHPKKFRLIAEALPLKSVKDVIEFYYVNRYTLSLKEKEGARRKRGGKKKVISEGSAKTTK